MEFFRSKRFCYKTIGSVFYCSFNELLDFCCISCGDGSRWQHYSYSAMMVAEPASQSVKVSSVALHLIMCHSFAVIGTASVTE